MTNVAVRITGVQSSKVTDGEVQIQYWDRKERLVRALKKGAMCWGFAVVAVLIPGLHFVLVPGILLAGPIVFYMVSARKSAVMGGKGTCPECGKPFPIAAGPDRFPLSDLCTECKNAVTIERK